MAEDIYFVSISEVNVCFTEMLEQNVGADQTRLPRRRSVNLKNSRSLGGYSATDVIHGSGVTWK